MGMGDLRKGWSLGKGRKARGSRRGMNDRRLRVESLESRALLSVSPWAAAAGWGSPTPHPAAIGGYSYYQTPTRYTFAAEATQIQVGTPVTLEVHAVNAYGMAVPGYAGTATLSTSDSAAVLPNTVNFSGGVAYCSATFNTAGPQTLTATDTVNGGLGSTASLNVMAAPVASKYTFVLRTPAQAGTPASLQVSATDIYGRLVTSYTGTAKLSSSDGAVAFAPQTVTFVGGTANFQVTFAASGWQTLTATDTANPSLTTTAMLIVAPRPAVAAKFNFNLPSSVQTGTAVTVQVSAVDANGKLVPNFTGTAAISTSDLLGVVSPQTVTFAGGVAAFQVTFNTTGTQSVTAIDSADNLKGTASTTVSTAPPSTIPVTTSSNWSGYAVETNLTTPQTARSAR